MTDETGVTIADFEKSLNELEALVRDLEQGDLPLEKSLAAFERGVRLTRECQQALRQAEQRVEQLVKVDDDTLETRPFNVDDEGQ
ncbi:exodeoxyribonuclease VII small subunit [Marinobacter nanhaiticus D15-8W]|uniref:Exodeoxyribonuclease 7 small subunit n=1 Tax=Marinobacter nanhaiticus D15-8W TaxID=626887 RepID=N6W9A3_9GAMM|nr:exodeoxyribonuclease VII small subunit [Marinobacter nanhaiticus]ENO16844.1 exodeoxyribonuclease VII small subunit [Marinobacter nanhaiticus D15-8W]BES72660.1 exodeoxyribonuclease VII small subunit [Marinobacter nanhaiticus D15-8W]